MKMDIYLEDNLSPVLKKTVKQSPKILNYIVSKIAKAYAVYMRHQYLSGQYLDSDTGETRESTKFTKKGEGHFVVWPGTGIKGHLNYLNIFSTGGYIRPKDKPFLAWQEGSHWIYTRQVYIPRKPFIQDSFKSFFGSSLPGSIAKNVLNKIFKAKGM